MLFYLICRSLPFSRSLSKFLFSPTLFTFECLRPCLFKWMFVRLLPLILLSFIRSISCVISAFLTFRLRLGAWLNSTRRGRGSGSRSVAAIVERRFYNESLYLGKRLRLPHCAHRGIAVLFHSVPRVPAMQCERDDRCCFKGVLRFIAARRAAESNAFAEYFRSYEMRIV